ncbi:M55 family metallopeptidase [Clostridium thermosuccinogenes]|nr:M55 family metallopeptidase [Pseudoclostridium thermosuccinogenes]
MKAYISADLEGIAGVITKEHQTKGTPEYNEACRLLSQEVYSVVDGLVDAGVDEVYVFDAHSTGVNFLYDYMHPKAKYIMGYSHPNVRFPLLDSSFDFIILQGYHAMAGTEGAVLDHTFSSAHIHNVYVNGLKAGEIYIDALIASELKVPVAMVTGDDKAVKEALEFLPWVKAYETKKGIARHCALMTPPSVVRDELKKLAGQVVKEKDNFKLLDVPKEVEIHYEAAMTSDADTFNFKNAGMTRIDGRTVIKRGTGVWDTFRK